MRNQAPKTQAPDDDIDLDGDAPQAAPVQPLNAPGIEMLGMGGGQGPATQRQRAPIKTTVKRFRVEHNPASRDGSGNYAIVYNRAPTTIRAGKIIDARSFDLQALRDRGVKLVEHDEIEVEGL